MTDANTEKPKIILSDDGGTHVDEGNYGTLQVGRHFNDYKRAHISLVIFGRTIWQMGMCGSSNLDLGFFSGIYSVGGADPTKRGLPVMSLHTENHGDINNPGNSVNINGNLIIPTQPNKLIFGASSDGYANTISDGYGDPNKLCIFGKNTLPSTLRKIRMWDILYMTDANTEKPKIILSDEEGTHVDEANYGTLQVGRHINRYERAHISLVVFGRAIWQMGMCGSSNIDLGFFTGGSYREVNRGLPVMSLHSDNPWDSNNPVNSVNINGNLIVNGNITAYSCSCPSDKRLKQNIKELNSVYDSIKKLNPVTYELKENNENDYGLIAQEYFKLFPFTNNTKLTGDEPVDEDGKPIYYSIDYSKLSVILLQGLKETMNKLEEQILYTNKLENIINERLNKLEAKII